MGRELPVVTVCEFFVLATGYASPTGRNRPRAAAQSWADEGQKGSRRI
jgi:hypothetical protein